MKSTQKTPKRASGRKTSNAKKDSSSKLTTEKKGRGRAKKDTSAASSKVKGKRGRKPKKQLTQIMEEEQDEGDSQPVPAFDIPADDHPEDHDDHPVEQEIHEVPEV